MALSTAQKVSSLENEIELLQNAIRRISAEQEQSLAVLSKVKELSDMMNRRVERLEIKADKDAVGGKELY